MALVIRGTLKGWGPGQSRLLCRFKSSVEIDVIEKVKSEQRCESSTRLSGEKAFRAEEQPVQRR